MFFPKPEREPQSWRLTGDDFLALQCLIDFKEHKKAFIIITQHWRVGVEI